MTPSCVLRRRSERPRRHHDPLLMIGRISAHAEFDAERQASLANKCRTPSRVSSPLELGYQPPSPSRAPSSFVFSFGIDRARVTEGALVSVPSIGARTAANCRLCAGPCGRVRNPKTLAFLAFLAAWRLKIHHRSGRAMVSSVSMLRECLLTTRRFSESGRFQQQRHVERLTSRSDW
jgi:hypothetical protein